MRSPGGEGSPQLSPPNSCQAWDNREGRGECSRVRRVGDSSQVGSYPGSGWAWWEANLRRAQPHAYTRTTRIPSLNWGYLGHLSPLPQIYYLPGVLFSSRPSL